MTIPTDNAHINFGNLSFEIALEVERLVLTFLDGAFTDQHFDLYLNFYATGEDTISEEGNKPVLIMFLLVFCSLRNN